MAQDAENQLFCAEEHPISWCKNKFVWAQMVGKMLWFFRNRQMKEIERNHKGCQNSEAERRMKCKKHWPLDSMIAKLDELVAFYQVASLGPVFLPLYIDFLHTESNYWKKHLGFEAPIFV